MSPNVIASAAWQSRSRIDQRCRQVHLRPLRPNNRKALDRLCAGRSTTLPRPKVNPFKMTGPASTTKKCPQWRCRAGRTVPMSSRPTLRCGGNGEIKTRYRPYSQPSGRELGRAWNGFPPVRHPPILALSHDFVHQVSGFHPGFAILSARGIMKPSRVPHPNSP